MTARTISGRAAAGNGASPPVVSCRRRKNVNIELRTGIALTVHLFPSDGSLVNLQRDAVLYAIRDFELLSWDIRASLRLSGDRKVC